jgi:hypothetical protein
VVTIPDCGVEEVEAEGIATKLGVLVAATTARVSETDRAAAMAADRTARRVDEVISILLCLANDRGMVWVTWPTG